MTLISVPKLSKAAFAAAFFLLSCQPPAVQKQSPVTPKTAVNNIPTLNLGSQKYPMPSAIKQKVLAKGLNPNSMTVVPRKELKTLAEQWQQRQKSPIPNANFAIQQLIPPIEDQVSCDWDTMNICGYENVGNWDEYYDAMYNSAGYQEELCVYERKEYCAYSEDEACHISYTEMQFQGCDCPEGYEKVNNDCQRFFDLSIFYETNPSSELHVNELNLYPFSKEKNKLLFKLFPKTEYEEWLFVIENSKGDEVFKKTGYYTETVLWEGKSIDALWLEAGEYHVKFSSGNHTKNVSVFIDYEGKSCPPGTLKLSPGYCTEELWKITDNNNNDLTGNSKITLNPVLEQLTFLIPRTNKQIPWLFKLTDSSGRIIHLQEGNTQSNIGLPLDFGDFIANRLRAGLYFVNLVSENQKLQKEIEIIYPKSIIANVYTSPDIYSQQIPFQFEDTGIAVLSSNSRTLIEVPVSRDDKFFFMEAFLPSPTDNRLELIDEGGSIIHYENLRPFYQHIRLNIFDIAHKQLHKGDYTLKIVSGAQSISYPLHISVDTSNDELELYHSQDMNQLLSSVAKRILDMERDVNWHITEAKAMFPSLGDFQSQQFQDPKPFRIQQQQIPTLDVSSEFKPPQDGEIQKSVLDEKNDELIRSAEILRQKVSWLQSIYHSSNEISESQKAEKQKELSKLKQQFYGIDTTSGCYNYYAYKPVWRDKKNKEQISLIQIDGAVIRADGGITVTGEIINPPDNFDYNTLSLDFDGEIEATSKTIIQKFGNGRFRIDLDDLVVTDKFRERIPSQGGGEPVSVRVVTNGFKTQASQAIIPSSKRPTISKWPPPPGIKVTDKGYLTKFHRVYGSGYMTGQQVVDSYSRLVYGNSKSLFQYEGNPYNDSLLDSLPLIGKDRCFSRDFFTRNVFYSHKLSNVNGQTAPNNGKAMDGIAAGTIELANPSFTFPKLTYATLLHELYHRKQFLEGDFLTKPYFQIEAEAYDLTINNKHNIKNVLKSISYASDDTDLEFDAMLAKAYIMSTTEAKKCKENAKKAQEQGIPCFYTLDNDSTIYAKSRKDYFSCEK